MKYWLGSVLSWHIVGVCTDVAVLSSEAIKGMSVPEARVGRGTESLQVGVRDLKKMWPAKVVYSASFSGIAMLTFCSEVCLSSLPSAPVWTAKP